MYLDKIKHYHNFVYRLITVIHISNVMYLKYLDDAPNCRLYFKPVEEHYIMEVRDKLKNIMSSDIDGISNSLIDLSENVIVKPLVIMNNQMLTTSIFPGQLKISKVIPLYIVYS